ncbi:unnamed protein product [Bacillus thuringiensis DB27]|uniref:Uncharacterized protein n=1 Tax=Bacillus thuringiensis DB27 TaxID=1431339 RepID=W8YCX9_BACTU|nr:unnamed protein product [Bacillus thuringiensis DB27]
MCKNPISIIIRIQHNIKVLPEILKACEQLHMPINLKAKIK